MNPLLLDLMNGNNHPGAGQIIFTSTDHIRYENGRDASGHNLGCKRAVQIEKNIDGNRGYTISIFNLDSVHPIWGNQLTMSPKQMEIIEYNASKILLRGYGQDTMGASFTAYGLTIDLQGNQMQKCTLHLYDRNIRIAYLP